MRTLIALCFALAVGCGEEKEEVGSLFQCQCEVACADGTSTTLQNTPHCYESSACAATGFGEACPDFAVYSHICGASTPTSCGTCTCGGALSECATDQLLNCPN